MATRLAVLDQLCPGDFAAVNEVYARSFGAHLPARSAVQVAGLPKGALVEVEVVAEVPGA